MDKTVESTEKSLTQYNQIYLDLICIYVSHLSNLGDYR